jgi:hypothetical protein
MFTARCLCEGVRLRVTTTLGPAIICHCSQCRRATGSAFACNAPVASKGVEFEAGQDLIREFESSEGEFRAFCSRCGSPIYSRRVSLPGVYRLRLGIVDGDPGVRPSCHLWVGSKASWFEITDSLPRFESVPDPSS